ncbi:hypothetical protein ONZ51_g12376 [Trametes cubensis]|uniref:WD40 repeat-like protein n=1 Tax=Trametes cubensis TaxID=1111947 RepID=A0AAD7TG18_9APHY|nr:hypothetical protein ONZ51_g12376 [Trametes cubensis]
MAALRGHLLLKQGQQQNYCHALAPKTPQHLENLVSLSEFLFIFAAAAVRFIGDQAERDPENRLTNLLNAGNAAARRGGASTSPFSILDTLYTQVLENAAKRLGDTLKARINLILGTIVLAEQHLSPTALDALLGFPAGTVGRVLPVLSAILTFPNGEGDPTPIGMIHLSFPNFLVDPTRCTNQSFLVRPRIQHSHIAFRCLSLMKALKYNILGVTSEHDRVLNGEIPDLPARLSRHLPAALEYACRYWTRHLCEAEVGEDLLTALEEFCASHLIPWLEALSLLGRVDGVVEALQSVQTHLKANTPIRRLAAANARTPLAVRIGLENTWSTTLVSRVIEKAPIETLAFSPDVMYIACAKGDGTIQLFNAQTAAELQIFQSHADETIRGVSFSPTSKELLSGSDDGTVRLWDVATGANLNTWKAHSDWVRSVAWSPDGTLAASASDDMTVRLWRMASPEKTVVLQHSGWVRHVLFASDGDLLTGSNDKTCKVWDTLSTDWDMEIDVNPTHTLEHDSSVMAVAVSSDSCLVACGLDNGAIILWTKPDKQRLRSLPGQSSDVICLAFYSNSLLAAAYENFPITLWDVSTGAPVKSADNEVQVHIHLWPSEMKQNTARTTEIAGKLKQIARRESSPVEDQEALGNDITSLRAAATSPTRKLVLAVHRGELRFYEISTGRCMHTIKHPSNSYPSATWSPTGRLFACTGEDHAVHVWKADTGELVGTFAGHSDDAISVVFTLDEHHILSSSWDGTILRGKIGKWTSSEFLLRSVGDVIWALAVSSDGQWILSTSFRRDSPPKTLSADLLAPPSRQPVKDRYGDYNTLRLHDTTTGHVIWVEHHSHFTRSVAFSEDCTRALAGNWKGEVFLYDLTQLIPPGPTVPCSTPPLVVPEHKLSVSETHAITRLSFSPNGRAVITRRTCTSIPSELQPLSTSFTDCSLTSICFYEDNWLWHVNLDSGPRRLCWIPPLFRPHDSSVESFPSASGQSIAYITLQGSLVVIDGASPCEL